MPDQIQIPPLPPGTALWWYSQHVLLDYIRPIAIVSKNGDEATGYFLLGDKSVSWSNGLATVRLAIITDTPEEALEMARVAREDHVARYILPTN